MRALICPMSNPGFLYPAIAIGLELQRRGHDVQVMGHGEVVPRLAEAGLAFMPVTGHGVDQAFDVSRWFKQPREQYLIIRRAAMEFRADVLVTSVLCLGAILAAEAMDIPVVVIGLTTHMWAYRANCEAEPEAPAFRAWRTRDMLNYYNDLREQVGFSVLREDLAGYPLNGTALLLRGDPVLEYPGAVLPDRVHYVGPCAWEPDPSQEELDDVIGWIDRVGKPVVYVHLGRVFGGTDPWPWLNRAFKNGRFQAVVELGRTGRARPATDADLKIVRMPWMGPVLDRAGLVLTGGTSAPVLNALLRGLTLGVAPEGSEQPLLAEACVRSGVAAYLPTDQNEDLRSALESLWHDTKLRDRAKDLGGRLSSVVGECRAADIVENVVETCSCAGRVPPSRQDSGGIPPESSLVS